MAAEGIEQIADKLLSLADEADQAAKDSDDTEAQQLLRHQAEEMRGLARRLQGRAALAEELEEGED